MTDEEKWPVVLRQPVKIVRGLILEVRQEGDLFVGTSPDVAGLTVVGRSIYEIHQMLPEVVRELEEARSQCAGRS